MIDAGSNGLCILANFSEQFVLTDAEREQVMHAVLEHVAGRVPVIVTTTHFGSRICAERSRQAQDAGAAMVMIMPPYHGATFRVPEKAIFDFYRTVSDAIDIPIMIQDAPVAGTPLSVDLLARMAREIPNVSYFKIEVPMAAAKLRDLIAAGGNSIEGPWDGEEAITLMADLDAGATGAMTGGGYPDGIRQIVDPYLAGRREDHVRQDLRRTKHGLAHEVLVRHLVVVRSRNFPLACGSDDAEPRIEGNRRHGQARRMDDVTGSAAEDGVILILAVDGEASRSTLLQAIELLVAVVPAARALIQIAADGPGVANLRRADFGRRLGQRGIHLPRVGVGDEVRERDGAPDPQTTSRSLGDGGVEILHADETIRLRDVVLHQAEEIHATGERERAATWGR